MGVKNKSFGFGFYSEPLSENIMKFLKEEVIKSNNHQVTQFD